MDELDDLTIPSVPLHAAKESSEIRRSEVFCSKIIHQRSNHQIRFRRSTFYLKLVQHSHPEITALRDDNEYPRPLSSPFPCFQCHRKFSTPPIGIPMEMLDRRVEEWGNFCSGPCGMTYMDKNMHDSNLSTRIADFFEYMQDYHGFRGSEIGYAPHFTQHVNYGGDLTDEQFDAIIGNTQLTTHILMKPYIPTDAVIEWQYSGGPPAPGSDVLTRVMQAPPPETDHHHRWDATHLKQPSMEAIEERLASLPKLPKTTGLYELYIQRKGGLDGPLSDEEAPATGAGSGRNRKKANVATAQAASSSDPPAPFADLLTSASKKKRKTSTAK